MINRKYDLLDKGSLSKFIAPFFGQQYYYQLKVYSNFYINLIYKLILYKQQANTNLSVQNNKLKMSDYNELYHPYVNYDHDGCNLGSHNTENPLIIRGKFYRISVLS